MSRVLLSVLILAFLSALMYGMISLAEKRLFKWQ